MVIQPDEIKSTSRDKRIMMGVWYEYCAAEHKCAMAAGLDIVYNRKQSIKQNETITEIKHIITSDLLSDLGKLFTKTSHNDTVSLFALDIQNNNELSKELLGIEKEYEKYKEIRDKRISHLDMDIFKKMESVEVNINEVQDLLLRIKEFIKKVYPDWKKYCEFYDFNEKRDNFEEQFDKIFKSI